MKVIHTAWTDASDQTEREKSDYIHEQTGREMQLFAKDGFLHQVLLQIYIWFTTII